MFFQDAAAQLSFCPHSMLPVTPHKPSHGRQQRDPNHRVKLVKVLS
jgi:hypothetical protein